MPQPKDLLAVLVDADNVSPSRMAAVLAEAASFGTASVKRVYGDWTKPNLASWKTVASEQVIQPIQQFANTVGKNATDSALIIDAMDLLYTRRFHAFCIVSSDSDFTRLASRATDSSTSTCWTSRRRMPHPQLARASRRRNSAATRSSLAVFGQACQPPRATTAGPHFQQWARSCASSNPTSTRATGAMRSSLSW